MYSVESTNHPPTFLICCVNNWGKDFLTLDLGLVHCLVQYMSTSLFRFTVSSHTFYLLAKTSCKKKNWPKATYSTTTLLYINFAVKKSDDLFNF